MSDDLVGHRFSQAVPGVAGEEVLFRDFRQNRFGLIVDHGVATDLVLGCQARSIGEPLLDFLAAPVGMDIRRPGDGAMQGQIVFPPEPAEHEEGIAHAPGSGKDDMRIRAGIEDPAQLLHAAGIEDVAPFVFVGIQNPIHVEKDNVEMHLFQSRGCVKPISFVRLN